MTETIEQPKLLTPQIFEDLIEDIVWDKDISYVEAMLHYCDQNSVEPEDITKLINRTLKQKIEFDAMRDGLLPKASQLPV